MWDEEALGSQEGGGELGPKDCTKPLLGSKKSIARRTEEMVDWEGTVLHPFFVPYFIAGLADEK